MGVCIKSTNGKYSFDMGAGGFFNLRKNIAYCVDREFGEHYALLARCNTQAEYSAHDRKAEQIINSKGLDREYSEVLDFLYADDCGGKIDYRTCKKIYDLIKDVDFGSKCFRYAILVHNDYEEFKLFLRDCYARKCCMRWS